MHSAVLVKLGCDQLPSADGASQYHDALQSNCPARAVGVLGRQPGQHPLQFFTRRVPRPHFAKVHLDVGMFPERVLNAGELVRRALWVPSDVYVVHKRRVQSRLGRQQRLMLPLGKQAVTLAGLMRAAFLVVPGVGAGGAIEFSSEKRHSRQHFIGGEC